MNEPVLRLEHAHYEGLPNSTPIESTTKHTLTVGRRCAFQSITLKSTGNALSISETSEAPLLLTFWKHMQDGQRLLLNFRDTQKTTTWNLHNLILENKKKSQDAK